MNFVLLDNNQIQTYSNAVIDFPSTADPNFVLQKTMDGEQITYSWQGFNDIAQEIKTHHDDFATDINIPVNQLYQLELFSQTMYGNWIALVDMEIHIQDLTRMMEYDLVNNTPTLKMKIGQTVFEWIVTERMNEVIHLHCSGHVIINDENHAISVETNIVGLQFMERSVPAYRITLFRQKIEDF